MTKFSSFKEQQKLFENWRRHTENDKNDEEPMGPEVEPGLEDNSATHGEIDDAHGEDLKTALNNLSEDSEGDTAIVNLLSQISQKLDGLEDIDTSIDYLIGAVSGETALSAKMKQSTLGRFADAAPQLAELIKKRQKPQSIEENALSSGAAKTIEDAIARFNRLTSALERGVDPATQEEIEIVLMRDIVEPAMPMLRKAGIKAGESMQDTEEWLADEAAAMTARY